MQNQLPIPSAEALIATPAFALFENRLAPAAEAASLLFTGLREQVATSDLATLAAALASQGDWVVLALDYELGYLLEPAAAPAGWSPDPARPLARLWRFARCERLDARQCEAWLASSDSDDAVAAPAGIGGLRSACTWQDYLEAHEQVRRWIRAGDCYQVNLTFPLCFEWFGSPLALYRALRQRQPVRHGGIIADGQGSVVSLSPELFLDRRGTRLVTRPMKGTAPRDSNPELLRASEKNRAENLMIVDLLRNDLGRVATTGTVSVDALFELEEYPTVWQMVSQVSAELPTHLGTFALLRALFPCGSITGAPKIRAMQIAASLEGRGRGVYTGALGWQSPEGDDLNLNVAIRTLELGADGRGTLGVGSGVVIDSTAAGEWRECHLKAAFLSGLDPGVTLIETLRLDGEGYPRLDGHLRRLASSAQWFGFDYDEKAVREALAQAVRPGVWRVRLTLGRDGVPRISNEALAAEPDLPRRAVLARARIESRDPLRRHKTTARALYDDALRGVSNRPEVFDVVFANERGEIAEGARSTVFVERDGVLWTPPVDSGALPGVLRAELLAAGKAREGWLQPQDLRQGFWLGNALRGLIRIDSLEE